jgi:hypothetical protein
MSAHYVNRLVERMTAAEAQALVGAIGKLATTMPADRDFAVHVLRLPQTRGEWTFNPDGTGTSNGNNVWAIIRKGRVATVMLRRDAQPSTPAAFRVDAVGRAKLTGV